MGEVGTGLAVLCILLVGLWGLFLLIFFKGRRKKGASIFGAAFVALFVVGSLLGSQKDEIAREAGFEDHQSYSEALEAGINDPAEWALEVRRRAEVEAEEQRIREEEEARLEAERQARKEEARRAAAEEEARAE